VSSTVCKSKVERLLYEAAQSMLVRSTRWSWLKAWAMQIAKRRGMKRAIVALRQRGCTVATALAQ
jgi:hypothetical protein